MGRAEVGSAKYLANKMKEKGLNRLRWYCQLCEKSCRDENGFKMHCQSPSHVAKAQAAGGDIRKVQDDYSKEFQQNFIQLLKTQHGEKQININRHYQSVIAERHHVHMNATKWGSLTEFAKHLGREGICRVEDKGDDGIFVAWIDDSPEALKRKEAIRRKELQDRGDEEREQMMLREQIRRARKDAAARGVVEGDADENLEAKTLKREEGQKIAFSFGAKPAVKAVEDTKTESSAGPEKGATPSSTSPATAAASTPTLVEEKEGQGSRPPTEGASSTAKPISLKFGATKPQSKNVFKSAFAGPKKVMAKQPEKMSELERIMKEDMGKKRAREERDTGGPSKKFRSST